MSITFPGTAATTDRLGSASSTVDFNIPGSLSIGDLVLITWMAQSNRNITATGWTVNHFSFVGYAYKEVLGTEDWYPDGGTETFTFTGGTDDAWACAIRVAGIDTSDPFDGGNVTSGNSDGTATVSVSADGITGIDAGNLVFFGFAANANRTISAQDSDLTTIATQSGGNSCSFPCYEASPGTGNAAYSITMSGTRTYYYFIAELKAAAAGGISIPLMGANLGKDLFGGLIS